MITTSYADRRDFHCWTTRSTSGQAERGGCLRGWSLGWSTCAISAGSPGPTRRSLVTADGDDRLATDGRYTEQAAAESPDVRVVVARHCAVALVESVGADADGRLAFEAHDVSVEAFDGLAAAAGPKVELVRLGHVVEDLRRVKDADELDLLREACAIGDRALAELLPWLRPGWTEREVARRLEDLMLDHGRRRPCLRDDRRDRPALRRSRTTSPPTGRSRRATSLKLDFGALVAGYHADMTRTLVLGRAARTGSARSTTSSPRRRRRAERPGAGCDAAPTSTRRPATVIEEAGLGEPFPHGLGHGVGLEIHEAPLLGASGDGYP